MQQGLTKKIIYGVAIGGAAIFILMYAKKFHISSRERSILTIMQRNYANMENEYLKQWANAVAKGESFFSYNGNSYSSDTGKKA